MSHHHKTPNWLIHIIPSMTHSKVCKKSTAAAARRIKEKLRQSFPSCLLMLRIFPSSFLVSFQNYKVIYTQKWWCYGWNKRYFKHQRDSTQYNVLQRWSSLWYFNWQCNPFLDKELTIQCSLLALLSWYNKDNEIYSIILIFLCRVFSINPKSFITVRIL